MPRVETPHFSLPFRFENGTAAVVEQDSPEEVADCVEAALRTRVGDRPERPDYGTPDLTFSQQPIPLETLLTEVERWEPRARLLAEEHPDELDRAVTRVRLTLE